MTSPKTVSPDSLVKDKREELKVKLHPTNMQYTPKIYDPEMGISQIMAAASKFDAQRFLYALGYKNWNEQKIERKAKEVAEYRIKLEEEYDRLRDFAQVFNKQFATDNNSCFSSAGMLLRKLRSGLSEAKRLFVKFCPRAKRERISSRLSDKPRSAYTYSYISSDNYEPTIFDFKEYPACVSGLFEEMEKFFFVLVRCMQLCKQVLEDEEEIRKDSGYVRKLFGDFKNGVSAFIFDIQGIIDQKSSMMMPENNPAIADRSRFGSDEDWAPTAFHKYSRTEVKVLVIKQMQDEQAGSDLTVTEMQLFGSDVERVHKLREIIRGFDRLVPEEHKRKTLPPRCIKMFLRYAGINYLMEKKAVNYFIETYLAGPNHKYEKVSYTAVNGVKLPANPKEDEAYNAFVELIEERFFATQTLQTAVG